MIRIKNCGIGTIFAAIFLAAFVPSHTASAWSAQGHMTIAAMAYRDLPKEDRAKVDELLKHHPDYSNWTNRYSAELSPVDLEAFVVMRASTWPDEIRRKGNPYDHPQWHF